MQDETDEGGLMEFGFINVTFVERDRYDGNNSYNAWYSNSGSPTLLISGIVHRRSNAFDSTILKICEVRHCRKRRGTHLLHVDPV
jgi:hypothetical protein